MRLWTIRDYNIWRKEKSGKHHDFIWNSIDVKDHFWTAYHWIAKQMRERLKIPTRRLITFPVWAWAKKPDLRIERHRWDNENVLIEFEMPENEILISDYDDWHFVLNSYYFAKTQKEDREFERELRKANVYFRAFEQLPWKFRIRIEKSWERIFDIKKGKEVQVTMWEIPLKNILKVTRFKGKGRTNKNRTKILRRAVF